MAKMFLFSDQMHQICYESRQGNFLSKIQRTVDGVVLESRDERDEDCVITFQVFQKINFNTNFYRICKSGVYFEYLVNNETMHIYVYP